MELKYDIAGFRNILQMELDNLNRARMPRNAWEVARDRWWPYRCLGVSLLPLLRRWWLSRSTLGDDYRNMLLGVIERLSVGDAPDLGTQYKVVPKFEDIDTKYFHAARKYQYPHVDPFRCRIVPNSEAGEKSATAKKKPKCASRGKRKK